MPQAPKNQHKGKTILSPHGLLCVCALGADSVSALQVGALVSGVHSMGDLGDGVRQDRGHSLLDRMLPGELFYTVQFKSTNQSSPNITL